MNRTSESQTPTSTLPGPEALRDPWQTLTLLNLYRLTLALAFLSLFITGVGPDLLGNTNPTLYAVTAWAYFAAVLFSIATTRTRRPTFNTQVNTLVGVDILTIALLMHASGGTPSGLGILLIVTITSGTLISTRKSATYVYAALATLAVLAEAVYSDLISAQTATYYTQAGLLGAAFFATAVLDYTFARRVQHSQELAEQRGVDLANLSQLNEHIIQRLQSGILVVDEDGRVRLMNQAAWHLIGMPISGSQPPLAEICPELADQLQRWLANPFDTPQPFTLPGGQSELMPRFNRLARDAKDAIIYLEDQKQISHQAQQQKLASLGRMSASIAHEIRNPLGALSHAAQLLAESSTLPSTDQRLTRIIGENAQRVNTIIENVLQISRRQTSSPVRLPLYAWLEELRDEFCRAEGLPVEHLRIDVQPRDLEVLIDPSQLHQVVWNLCKNAMEHGANSSGEVRIELRAGMEMPSRHSFLDVIDHGPGIDPQTAQQIFEPFYTTRTRGTGLGLYLARQLCELNDAKLDYIAQPRGGSCFRIRFPRAQSAQ